MTTYPYIEARRTGGVRGNPSVLVLHTAETDETPTSAEGVARYFASGSGGRAASAHYTVDNDSTVQCVKDNVVAYAAPPLNEAGLHIEMCGRARQSAAEWLDPFSKAMLIRTARLAAEKCVQYGIPAVWLSENDLQRGVKGITTHNLVTITFRKSTHTDPGPNFPKDIFMLSLVTAINELTAPLPAPVNPGPMPLPPTPAPTPQLKRPTLKAGSKVACVKAMQFELHLLSGKPAACDGDFGPATTQAVKDFQRFCHLTDDGVCGPATWDALDTFIALKGGTPVPC